MGEVKALSVDEIRSLGERIRKRKEEGERIGRAPRGGPLPLSFAQERLWFLDRFAPGDPVYNIPALVRLAGRLDAPALRRTLTEVTRRHESLRTTFGERDGVPFQVIAPTSKVPLPLADLSALSPSSREGELLRLATREARRPFDLAKGPLFRATLLRLADHDHGLLLNLHHVVTDGWSQGVLIREMAVLYEALAAGRLSPLPEPPIQYADYAVWQRDRLRGELLEKEVAFWRERLAGTPPLEMPADRKPPMEPSFRGGRRDLRVPVEVAGRLHALCREEKVTSYMALLAAFQILLLRYSGQTDFAVGSPVANRGRSELEGLVGFFVNTLALRVDLSGQPTFRELLRRVKEVAGDAFSHEEMPFERIVGELHPQRDAGRSPIFQVMLALQSQPSPELVMGGLDLSVTEIHTGTAKLDLSLIWQEKAGRLLGTLEYSSDLFDAASAERISRHAVALLRAALEAPDRAPGELPMLSPGERRQLVVDWNGAFEAGAPETTLDRLIAAQAARTPDRPALIREDGSTVTYSELDRLSNLLAAWLRRQGVAAEVPVGVRLHRSAELVIALLAVWKAGGVYLPIDPSYPEERLAFMLEDAGARVVITPEVLALDGIVEDVSSDAPAGGASPRNLAYILYTSGSTGRPKAVGVEHAALIRQLRFIATRWGLSEESRVLQIHSPSFDPWFEDTVAPLLCGGAVVICGPEVWDPARLLFRAAGLGVTVMPLPTNLWHEWVRESAPDPQPGHGVRVVDAGGEAMSGEVARLWWRSPLSRIRLLNGYGPTEAVITGLFQEIGREAAGRAEAAVEIGSPNPGRTAHVLDRDGGLLPPGVPGELCLGGQVLSRGYIGRPELTAERFMPDPFAAEWGGEPGSRLYRTGDLARRRPDGILELLGRTDDQVKVRGIRIELGEIEAALGHHTAVSRTVVVAWRAAGGDTQLAAFVVPAAEAPAAADLRSHLAVSLPAFMAPSSFTFLEALPLTPNGKVDRKALARMAAEGVPASREYVPPRNTLEEMLAPLWEEILGVERVGADDDFFLLGGHSLLAIRLISKVDDRFGVRLAVRTLFQATTLGQMAERIAEEMAVLADDEFLQQLSAESEG